MRPQPPSKARSVDYAIAGVIALLAVPFIVAAFSLASPPPPEPTFTLSGHATGRAPYTLDTGLSRADCDEAIAYRNAHYDMRFTHYTCD